MKILIAPNAFKESLTAVEAAESLAVGLRGAFPEAEIETIPLADGGDGTLEVLTALWGGTIQEFPATDPLGRRIQAPVGFDPKSRRAVIEMARVSGLALLAEEERNPLVTTTFGLGELIREVASRKIEHLFLGIGGSATNDGGVGMAEALGYRHLDAEGNPVPPGGGHLHEIDRIVPPEDSCPFLKMRVDILSDVTNPLCGPEGASHVFGPQKGAGAEEVEILEDGLKHLARLWGRDLGKSVLEVPGSGAAGGVGGGALVYLDARLVSGAEAVFEMTNLREKLNRCDLVLTGEGCLDRTTLHGKLPGRVATLARECGKLCIGICGTFDPGDLEELLSGGFTEVLGIAPEEVPLEDRKQRADYYLRETATAIGRRIREGRGLV